MVCVEGIVLLSYPCRLRGNEGRGGSAGTEEGCVRPMRVGLTAAGMWGRQ